MLFKKKSRDAPEAAPDPAGPQLSPVDEAYAALHDELGMHRLWYLELRLREELARSARKDWVFSLGAWRPRLLPGEALPDGLIGQAGRYILQSLRAYDVVARMDEGRIVALLLDAKYEDSTTVAYRIKADLQVRVAGATKWQAGVATFGRDGVDGDNLIQALLRRLEDDARG